MIHLKILLVTLRNGLYLVVTRKYNWVVIYQIHYSLKCISKLAPDVRYSHYGDTYFEINADVAVIAHYSSTRKSYRIYFTFVSTLFIPVSGSIYNIKAYVSDKYCGIVSLPSLHLQNNCWEFGDVPHYGSTFQNKKWRYCSTVLTLR